jgi:hypothetical protein
MLLFANVFDVIYFDIAQEKANFFASVSETDVRENRHGLS